MVSRLQQMHKESELVETLRRSVRPEIIIIIIFPIQITTIRELYGWVGKFENQQYHLAVPQMVKISGSKLHLSEMVGAETSGERLQKELHDIRKAEVEAVQLRSCQNCR